jgi:hypothetical protein
LDFHHRDPHTKSFKIAHGFHYEGSRVVAEMKKCDVLCKTCHRRAHKGPGKGRQ